MSSVDTTAEEAVAKMIGEAFSGGAEPSESISATEAEIVRFEFDDHFQTKIAAFAVRDLKFMQRAAHLLNPDHFENIGEATMVSVAKEHFEKYKDMPSPASMATILKERVAKGTIRKDIMPMVIEAWNDLKIEPLDDRNYVEDIVAQFAQHQAVSQAILNSVDLLPKKKFAKILESFSAAVDIGLNEEDIVYDYFERRKERTEKRADKLAGKLPPTGITTGIHRMDEKLYHKGWGRRELATIMGGAKSGKTTALINFAKAASLNGHNVLYATLEVSAEIASERLDACVTDTLIKDLDVSLHTVEEKLEKLAAKSGKLNIIEFASGTLSPGKLQSIIEKHRNNGITYDLIVVDYADIMKPNIRTNEPIENSKSIYIDLRAIAFEFNAAVLTATQTNREGHKATVAKAEHVSEDFNKVRTVDLMISINKTEEEAKKGEARLFFAASRNQESGFTIIVKQNIAMMKFVESVIDVI